MHGLDIVDGKATIAFVGEACWHGLGQNLTRGAPIEVWAKEAQLDYPILRSKVKYELPMAESSQTLAKLGVKSPSHLAEFNDRVVLYRGDTNAGLSIVSSKYKVVQPKEVLEFFRDLVEQGGGKMYLETAGALFGGRQYWAMANTNMEGDVIKNDRVRARLLIVSSCDGTLATTAKYIAERVVCNNTLRVAMSEIEGKKDQVRVTHGGEFDPHKIKATLGLIDEGFATFMSNLKKLAAKKVTDLDVKKFIADSILDKKKLEQFNSDEVMHARVQAKLDHIFNLYSGNGMGADLVKGTLWGALNAVTEHADHEIGEKSDNKLFNSWFGYTDNIKNKAFELAMDMV